MHRHSLAVRTAIGGTGAAIILGTAGAAIAAPVQDDSVDVNVTIDAVEPVGALMMSIANTSTALAEVASEDVAKRSFAGKLPTVTIVDDRSEVPADASWYVVGQASDLTSGSGAPAIGPENLGWTPALLSGDDGSVAIGDETVPALEAPTNQPASDNNVGLEGQELLALALDSASAAETGTWTADADLKLTTSADVAPGAYSGTITLSLWEDSLAG